MLETPPRQSRRHRWVIGVGLAAVTLTLAACGGSPPLLTSASESALAVRCAFTPDGSASASVQIASFAFGDDVTVTAGQAVAFTNQDGAGHTVTEGEGGQAADGACIDQSIGGGRSVIVTFTEPGDFQITCKIHPSMQMAVHVE